MRWFVLLVFGGIGLALLGNGVRWGIDDFLYAESARGTVVQQYEDRSDAKTITYYPVIEFRKSGGEAIRFRSVLGSNDTPQYEQGSEVDVLYYPRDPAKARIGSFGQIWTGPVGAFAFGVVILVLSLRLFLKIGRFEKGLASYGSDRYGRG